MWINKRKCFEIFGFVVIVSWRLPWDMSLMANKPQGTLEAAPQPPFCLVLCCLEFSTSVLPFSFPPCQYACRCLASPFLISFFFFTVSFLFFFLIIINLFETPVQFGKFHHFIHTPHPCPLSWREPQFYPFGLNYARLQEAERDRSTAEEGTRKFKQNFAKKADNLQKQIAQREKQM